MAVKKIVQEIADDSTECTQYYKVEYKLTSETAYNMFIAFSSPITTPIVLDNSEYDLRITRYCCNGGISAPLELVVDTSALSPVLAAPANFTLSPDSPPVSEQLVAEWDDVPNATEYIVQLSENALFTVINFTATIDDPTLTWTFTGLTTGTTYYGRVFARASGYADSDFSNTDSALTP